jgi:hypothetical protein
VAKSGSSTSANGSRVVALDALRGLLVVLMALNHVPTNIEGFTNHPLGFVSSAEGFMFLSGLIGGFVFVRKLSQDGLAVAGTACWRRAATIYGYHAAAFLLVFAWIGCFALANDGVFPGNTPSLMAEQPGTAIWSGLLLLYQPSLFDVLPIYFLMLIALPGILVALQRGYRAFVLAASLGLWAYTNWAVPQAPYATTWVHWGVFNLGAWQLLFVVGAVFGHAWARGLKPLTSPPRWLVLCAVTFVTWCFGVRHAFLPPGPLGHSLDWLTNKNNLAPLRLLDASVLFYLVYLATARWPRAFHWQPLAFLGRHALPVFAAHILVAYFINAFPETFAQTTPERWCSTILMLLSLFAVASLHGFFLAGRRRSAQSKQLALRPFPKALPAQPAAFKLVSR